MSAHYSEEKYHDHLLKEKNKIVAAGKVNAEYLTFVRQQISEGHI